MSAADVKVEKVAYEYITAASVQSGSLKKEHLDKQQEQSETGKD